MNPADIARHNDWPTQQIPRIQEVTPIDSRRRKQVFPNGWQDVAWASLALSVIAVGGTLTAGILHFFWGLL